MGNPSSAKGNPASKRMMNPKNKEKRARNKLINEKFEKDHDGVSRKAYRNLAKEDRKIALAHARVIVKAAKIKTSTIEMSFEEIRDVIRKIEATKRFKKNEQIRLQTFQKDCGTHWWSREIYIEYRNGDCAEKLVCNRCGLKRVKNDGVAATFEDRPPVSRMPSRR